MKFVRRFHIGPHPIEVWDVAGLEDHGQFHTDSKPWKIYRCMEDSAQVKLDTELHEILHALQHVYRLFPKGGAAAEEVWVRLMEAALTQAGVGVRRRR